MALYEPTRAAWTAVSATGLGQARNGRIYWAASNTPADGDWLVLADGATVTVLAPGYVRAHDDGAVFAVVSI